MFGRYLKCEWKVSEECMHGIQMVSRQKTDGFNLRKGQVRTDQVRSGKVKKGKF